MYIRNGLASAILRAAGVCRARGLCLEQAFLGWAPQRWHTNGGQPQTKSRHTACAAWPLRPVPGVPPSLQTDPYPLKQDEIKEAVRSIEEWQKNQANAARNGGPQVGVHVCVASPTFFPSFPSPAPHPHPQPAPQPNPTQPTRPPFCPVQSSTGPLLQRVGGSDVVKHVVELFYRHLYADPSLIKFLHDQEMTHLRAKQSAFISWCACKGEGVGVRVSLRVHASSPPHQPCMDGIAFPSAHSCQLV